MAFWMDTICVPVQKEYKQYRKLAIAMMRDIYQQADAVLVLDSWLQGISHSVDITEKTVRLYLANWQRRLWTLQEGVLAKNLYMQFQDGAQNMEDVSEGLLENRMTGPGFYSTIADKCYGRAAIPYTFLNSLPSESDEVIGIFLPYAAEIQNRATTRKSDETICFATLLKLNPTELLEAPEGERMMKFLAMVKHFNRNIIFNTYPRLPNSGFRWAPTSFMDRSKSLFPSGMVPDDPDRSQEDDPFATLKPNGGLQLTYAGIKLGPINSRSAKAIIVVIGDVTDADAFKLGFKIWLQEDEVVHWSSWDPKLRYAIVLYPYWPYASPGEPSAAILGALEQEDEPDELKLRHIARLWVLLLEQNSKEQESAVKALRSRPSKETKSGGRVGVNDKLCPISGTWLGDEQRWCII